MKNIGIRRSKHTLSLYLKVSLCSEPWADTDTITELVRLNWQPTIMIFEFAKIHLRSWNNYGDSASSFKYVVALFVLGNEIKLDLLVMD